MITSLMIKQKLAKSPKLITLSIATILALAAVMPVAADQYDDQINQLKAENGQLQTQHQTLTAEAASFQEAIAGLAAQITSLEAQITQNEAERNSLQAEITHHKGVLGQNIRAMYLDDNISTFEVLASSNDLGSFMDKEQYRATVQDKVTTTLDTINQLKSKLDTVIANQQAAQKQLDSQRAEQARLLALNESQRAQLDSTMKNNVSQINKLRGEQAAANARLFGNGLRNVADNSGYPWSGVAFPNSISDPWGMYMRQCVSYTAWKVANSGRYMPYWGGRGNAKQWDDNARAAGIPVDGNPRVGDVAVSNTGEYGHVMYVEAVFDDGTIYVSQYNASWTGTYSEARIPVGALVFIHF